MRQKIGQNLSCHNVRINLSDECNTRKQLIMHLCRAHTTIHICTQADYEGITCLEIQLNFLYLKGVLADKQLQLLVGGAGEVHCGMHFFGNMLLVLAAEAGKFCLFRDKCDRIACTGPRIHMSLQTVLHGNNFNYVEIEYL